MIFNNYAFQSVSDKGKTQAPLHSSFAVLNQINSLDLTLQC